MQARLRFSDSTARSGDRLRRRSPRRGVRSQKSGGSSAAPTTIGFSFRKLPSADVDSLVQASCQRFDFATRRLTIPIASAIPAVPSNKVYPPMIAIAQHPSPRRRRINAIRYLAFSWRVFRYALIVALLLFALLILERVAIIPL